MDWLELARTSEFLALWKHTFADAAALLAGSQGPHASDRAYTEGRALWVEVREPLDGVRLITLELPTDIRPPRVNLRVWTYRPYGDQVYNALDARRYLWKGMSVARYTNDRPKPSWQNQLNAAGVQVNGIRHYVDLSKLAASSRSEVLQTLHEILESFCGYVAAVAAADASVDKPSETAPEAPAPAPSESAQLATAAVPQSTEFPSPEVEILVREVQDLLGIDADPRFSQEPPPMRVALANARIGQGGYRQRMLEVWGRCCAMTGCPVEAVLIASHARPWSLCETAQQCLDEYNGLLLSANLDRLFDQGLIAFREDGMVLTRGESAIETVVTAERLRFVDPRHVPYLTWHRNHFGFA
jgi:hypothetical protein